MQSQPEMVHEQKPAAAPAATRRGSLRTIARRVGADLRSPTARTITGVFSAKLLAHLMTIASGVLIARVLGAEGKGMVTSILLVPVYLATFGHLGLPTAVIYFLGRGRRCDVLLSNAVAFIIAAAIIFALVAFPARPILQASYFAGVDSPVVFAVVLFTIALLLAKNFAQAFLRGLEAYRAYNRSMLLQHGLRLLLLLACLLLSCFSVEAVVVAGALALLLSNFYAWRAIGQTATPGRRRLSRPHFGALLRFGLREYGSQVFATLNLKIDLLILAAFMAKAEIGIYSVVLGLAELFQFVPLAIGVVLLPKVSRREPAQAWSVLRKSMLYTVGLLVAALAFFWAFGEWLLRVVYGSDFVAAYDLTVIVLAGSLLISLVQLANKYFSGTGRPELKMKILLLALPVKAIAMPLLIWHHGLTGAAWSYTITAASVLGLTLFFATSCKRGATA